MHPVFETHPQLEKCFVTSDAEAFYQENDAKNHSKTLKDKTVETVYNEKFLDVVDAEDVSDDFDFEEEQEAADKAKAEQEAADKATADKTTKKGK